MKGECLFQALRAGYLCTTGSTALIKKVDCKVVC